MTRINPVEWFGIILYNILFIHRLTHHKIPWTTHQQSVALYPAAVAVETKRATLCTPHSPLTQHTRTLKVHTHEFYIVIPIQASRYRYT
jgi:hypothetical protein